MGVMSLFGGPLKVIFASSGSLVKNPLASAGDPGSIPGSAGSPEWLSVPALGTHHWVLSLPCLDGAWPLISWRSPVLSGWMTAGKSRVVSVILEQWHCEGLLCLCDRDLRWESRTLEWVAISFSKSRATSACKIFIKFLLFAGNFSTSCPQELRVC